MGKGKILLDLFWDFFKIGAFTFGGGYAMIPAIEKDVVERRKYITGEELLDMVAVAESTPGPIAINVATFVGQRAGGFWGAVSATLGVVLPSFSIIALLSQVLFAVQDMPVARYAFVGIRAAVLALIAKALVNMYRKCPKGLVSYILMAAALAAVVFLNLPAVAVILGCAVFGVVKALWEGRKK